MQGSVPTCDQLEEMGKENTKVCVYDQELTPKIIFYSHLAILIPEWLLLNYAHKNKEVVTQDF